MKKLKFPPLPFLSVFSWLFVDVCRAPVGASSMGRKPSPALLIIASKIARTNRRSLPGNPSSHPRLRQGLRPLRPPLSLFPPYAFAPCAASNRELSNPSCRKPHTPDPHRQQPAGQPLPVSALPELQA